jgi:hypothetical protein
VRLIAVPKPMDKVAKGIPITETVDVELIDFNSESRISDRYGIFVVSFNNFLSNFLRNFRIKSIIIKSMIACYGIEVVVVKGNFYILINVIFETQFR